MLRVYLPYESNAYSLRTRDDSFLSCRINPLAELLQIARLVC